ncbi:competence/damage-inducible protein A [Sinomicrobium sp.]
MQAEIITIGDELLIGQVVDTNATFVAGELNSIGISVCQITSVQDEEQHILTTLKEAGERADIIVITGGLGPTKDDITKRTLCRFFEDSLVQNKEVLRHIEELFKGRVNGELSELNRSQALVPSRAEVLTNRFGTAPGMWMEKAGKVYIFLPGVPLEMEALVRDEVLPRLQDAFERPFILHRTLITYGMGESDIANMLEAWEDALPDFVKLAYLPDIGKVRLRLTAKGSDREQIEAVVDQKLKELYAILGDVIFDVEQGQPLEILLKRLLTEKGNTLALAESCTGGRIAAQLTSVPGASAYFKGGIVSYATELKKDILGIPSSLIDKYSVVSEEVACAMAKSIRKLLKTDYALATTGNAGPSKGESDAAVGTAFIGLATPERVYAQKFNFGNHREKVVNRAVTKALEILGKEILKN